MKLRNLVCGALLCASTLLVGCGDDDNDFIGNDTATGNGSTYNLSLQSTNGSNANLGNLISGSAAGAATFATPNNTNPTRIQANLTVPNFSGQIAGVRTLQFTINDNTGIQAGETFQFSNNPNNQGAFADYTEQGQQALRRWISTGGTVTVTEIDSTGVNVQFNNSQLNPSGDGGNTATGTIIVNGAANLNY